MNHCRAAIALRRFRRSGVMLLVGAVVCAAGGCLNLGGKTTYMQNSPETEARIAGLETRVGALEQAVATRSAPSMQYADETIPSR